MSPAAPDFAERVRAAVRAIPVGTVVTYADIAAEVGRLSAARAVGNVLAAGSCGDIPWWRVVAANGRLVPHAVDEHAGLLAQEGHVCHAGRLILPPKAP